MKTTTTTQLILPLQAFLLACKQGVVKFIKGEIILAFFYRLSINHPNSSFIIELWFDNRP